MLPLTELGHSRQGQPNEMEGGVKQASSPCVRMESQRSTTLMQSAPTYQEVPTPDYGGMALYPSKQPSKNDSQAETTEHEVMLLQRMGGCTYGPPKNPSSDYQYR